MVGAQSLMMPNRVHDGEYARFDSWQGYPQEREHLLQHIAQNGIADVVFLAGDVHTFVAGDVCAGMGSGRRSRPSSPPGRSRRRRSAR